MASKKQIIIDYIVWFFTDKTHLVVYEDGREFEMTGHTLLQELHLGNLKRRP